MMDIVITTRELHKTYNTNGVMVEALRGVDLEVAAGEFVGVMGPSGCGKSTLLHLLGGLDLPTRGDVYVVGERMNGLSESHRALLRRRTIGFVFQAYNLLPNLSVADNVELPGLLVGNLPKAVVARREQLLEALGIPEKARSFPGELSGGQQQRVAIARALVNQPTVLLVDEPTGNLDSRSGNEVMRLLRHFHDGGQTILLVTHDPQVAGFAERVIFMQDGRLVDEVEVAVPEDGSVVLSRLAELER
jgi:putative ABC transport system ATP-binding protein